MAYVVVWEFRIKVEKESEFIKHYGTDGSWASFFRSGAGYIRTELVKDAADPTRFLTLDYWQSQSEFKKFRDANLAEYERLDKEFEGLTEKETRLGSFWIGDAETRAKS